LVDARPVKALAKEYDLPVSRGPFGTCAGPGRRTILDGD
jgi:hypothetical protein